MRRFSRSALWTHCPFRNITVIKVSVTVIWAVWVHWGVRVTVMLVQTEGKDGALTCSVLSWHSSLSSPLPPHTHSLQTFPRSHTLPHTHAPFRSSPAPPEWARSPVCSGTVVTAALSPTGGGGGGATSVTGRRLCSPGKTGAGRGVVPLRMAGPHPVLSGQAHWARWR